MVLVFDGLLRTDSTDSFVGDRGAHASAGGGKVWSSRWRRRGGNHCASDSERVSGHAAAWRRLLTTRNFGWLWSGQVISQIGDGLTKVALLFFVYDLTGSALKMTVIGVL